ncbi:response regulator [Pseudobdellovibrio exovorus]|uniref:histidine kinase n=1 Tax=Pseudobdellovibrio exovorus JSS TaxID=1184267 RepID=M4VC04_9BACT|nr:response regulator [Pseudobdellovibrio exovorus]AGH95995.1 hypothetical protein A11Q_1779 [Pseudobdellovibrio exovorus JSS]
MLHRKIDRIWKDLSVSKKLYVVVGLMTFLIVFELLTLKYTANILSSVRGFVAGESLWSKSQKDALLAMHNYIVSKDEKYYGQFLEHLAIPLNDRIAREELEKAQPDHERMYQSFINGGIHPDDIPSMIHLIRYYKNFSYVQNSLEAWRQGDTAIDEILALGQTIHQEVEESLKGSSPLLPIANQDLRLQQLAELNVQVSAHADRFSYTLAEAARWVETQFFLFLLFAILVLQSAGLYFAFRLSKGLLHSLLHLNKVAYLIGTGDFSQRIPVDSLDELGQLASSLNLLSLNLQNMSGEKDQAEEANQVKSLFLANMSHEIRTPLGAILGFVEILKEPNLSDEQRKQYLNIISRTGDTLVTIINDILDLSKVEAGKIEVVKEVFSLSQLLRDVELLMKLRSEAKGIELVFESSRQTPEVVYSDPLRLRQILINIIGNAIKFTQRGSVRVYCEATPSHLLFRISDTGLGVESQDVAKLFRPFSQADLSIRKMHGGTGLGLVLSRELARLLEGDIELESTQPGVGSVFVVKVAYRIPRHLRPEKVAVHERIERQAAIDPMKGIQGKHILLVEDTSENQILITHILSKSGATVQVAHNGQEALECVDSGTYDLILMDMQMPILDGYSATRMLREKGYRKPIISLTAHAMREDLRKCIEVGCDDVLTKPINKVLLIETLTRYCN